MFFLAMGFLLFAAQRWLVGEPRVIVVTPGLEAALARRFEDLQGRKPDAPELAAELRQWQRDEALFREAQRRRLDRDDPGVRSVLVGAMRARAAAEVPERAPTEAELESWLASHRARYEEPLRYDFDFLEFDKAAGAAQGELERFARAIAEGAKPASLGRPLLGANLTLADMPGRIAPELAARIPSLPVGQWQRVETDRALLLARLEGVSGGLPSLELLRPRLIADWSLATREAAVDRILQQTVDRYRVEVRP